MPQELTPPLKRRKPAHRADSPPRKRLASVSGLLTASALIGAGAFLGLTGTGETYAFLNGSATSNGGNITSGTMSLKVGVAGSEGTSYTVPSATWSSLFPGDSAREPVSVKVTNSPSRVSSAMSIRTTAAVPDGYELRVQKGSCPATALTGSALSMSDVSFGTWGPAETSIVCVEIRLRIDAPSAVQSTTVGPIGMTVTAKQQ